MFLMLNAEQAAAAVQATANRSSQLFPARIAADVHYLPSRAAQDPQFADLAWLADLPAVDLRAIAHLKLSERRKQAEQSFSWAGTTIRLDEGTQARIAAAEAGLARQPEGTTVSWQIAASAFVDLDLPTLRALGGAAFTHVQACFSNAKVLAAAIDAAADDDAIKSISFESGWPS